MLDVFKAQARRDKRRLKRVGDFWKKSANQREVIREDIVPGRHIVLIDTVDFYLMLAGKGEVPGKEATKCVFEMIIDENPIRRASDGTEYVHFKTASSDGFFNFSTSAMLDNFLSCGYEYIYDTGGGEKAPEGKKYVDNRWRYYTPA